jgi:hypothetical protein
VDLNDPHPAKKKEKKRKKKRFELDSSGSVRTGGYYATG